MPDLSHTIVFRAVHGAVRNTLRGHPDWRVPDALARSVAKRAAGTLAGLAPDTALAAARRSEKRGRSLGSMAARNGYQQYSQDRGRALVVSATRALPAIKRHLDVLARDAWKAGDQDRFTNLCAAARAIKHEIARGKGADA